jgi:uncharacterized protein (DUF2062 family)
LRFPLPARSTPTSLFVIAIAIGASAGFTPFGYQTNLMVVLAATASPITRRHPRLVFMAVTVG